MIAITGATGHLGRLVIQELVKKIPANQIIAAVRNPAKAQDLAQMGVTVREADYDKPETWRGALAGASKVLLISSSDVGKRAAQHRTVIDASKQAGAGLLVYTSLLRAATSGLGIAIEHRATEEIIRKSGMPFVVLRNGWYLENHTEHLAQALEHGVILGSAGAGRIASASRSDYAEACVAALTGDGHANKIYELAGDHAFTLAELAGEVSRKSGKAVKYEDMSAADYERALLGVGLPAPVAEMLVDCDVATARGDLDSDSADLRMLIGRPTVTLAAAVKKAVVVSS